MLRNSKGRFAKRPPPAPQPDPAEAEAPAPQPADPIHLERMARDASAEVEALDALRTAAEHPRRVAEAEHLAATERLEGLDAVRSGEQERKRSTARNLEAAKAEEARLEGLLEAERRRLAEARDGLAAADPLPPLGGVRGLAVARFAEVRKLRASDVLRAERLAGLNGAQPSAAARRLAELEAEASEALDRYRERARPEEWRALVDELAAPMEWSERRAWLAGLGFDARMVARMA